MGNDEWTAVLLTIKLATATTTILLIFSPFLAWWFSQKNHLFASFLETLIALPLILPPTVLGFYLLIAFSPSHAFGQWWLNLTGETLSFSFYGLLLASMLYSLPFAVQPLIAAFRSLDTRYVELGSTFGMNFMQRFFTVVLPMSWPALLSAALLSFAHTVGEFGVVLMIGGNIPGETRVLSIALFDQVETMNFNAAHRIAGGLMVFSILTLWLVYGVLGYHRKQN